MLSRYIPISRASLVRPITLYLCPHDVLYDDAHHGRGDHHGDDDHGRDDHGHRDHDVFYDASYRTWLHGY